MTLFFMTFRRISLNLCGMSTAMSRLGGTSIIDALLAPTLNVTNSDLDQVWVQRHKLIPFSGWASPISAFPDTSL
jgi:hypothetical protein